MPGRKIRGLWMTAIVAMVAIFACGGVRAAGPCLSQGNANLPRGECVNLWGYDVKVDRTADPSGLFPYYLDVNSVYTWSLIPVTAKYAVGHIDLKIPVSIGSLIQSDPSTFEVMINGCPLTYATPTTSNPGYWMLYPAGKGDSSVSFGAYEYDYQVLKFIPATGCPITTGAPSTLKVTFNNNKLFSGLDSFLIKAATKGGAGEAKDLLGPSLISQSDSVGNQPPLRSVESFKLGESNCTMVVTLNSDGLIANAFTRPFTDDGPGCTGETLPIEPISKTIICDKDVSENPVNCKAKKFVEQNIIDKSGDGSRYCYYTTTGQQVCKTF
jgi:hypothetical protein